MLLTPANHRQTQESHRLQWQSSGRRDDHPSAQLVDRHMAISLDHAYNGLDHAAGTVSMKKILFVDDEPTLVATVKYNLEREGYDVVTAGDGEAAPAKTTPT
jgi:PleD family two-component response regulator